MYSRVISTVSTFFPRDYTEWTGYGKPIGKYFFSIGGDTSSGRLLQYG